MDTRHFVYDEPRPFLSRLFKLDINGEGEPLSGKLMSFTNSDTAWNSLNLLSFAKSIAEDADKIIEVLGDGKGYDALSYCWGESDEKFTLIVSTLSSNLRGEQVLSGHEANPEGVLEIQSSLHELLLQLRRRRYNRFIWIDAICIDQSSPVDKENQIPLMRELYEHAEHIYVWLGEASKLEMMAFQMIPQLRDKLFALKEHSGLNLADAASFEAAGLPRPTDEVWRALGILLARPWFSRIWTLQEVVVAKNKTVAGGDTYPDYNPPEVYVLCGSGEMHWATLEDFIAKLSCLGLEEWILTGHHGLSIDHRHAFDAVMEIRTCRESYRRMGWSVSLSALLLATRRRKATMPVDVVIGQSALLDRHTMKELALRPSDLVEHVFTSFAKHYIRQEPKECLLNHIATRVQDLRLPSWCPNFASPPETIPLGSRWLGHYDSTKEQKAQMYHAGFTKTGKWRIPRSRIYYAKYLANAASGSDSLRNQYNTDNRRQVQLIPDTNNILLSGIELDEIVEVIPCNRATENAKFLSFDSIQQTTYWDAACLALARRTSPEGAEGFDIYARTLLANRVVMYPNNNTERVFDPTGEVDFVGSYLSMKRFMQATLEGGETIAEKGNISRDTLRYVKVLERVTKRRTFFATKNGRIGIGPAGAVAGDRLVVVFFTPTPYLFRQVSGEVTFKIIGETYVHGLMYGEVLEMFDKGHVQESKWVIT